MSNRYSQTLMDQRIFQCSLSVETVSVYLLCTGLADAAQNLTIPTLLSVWNGDESTLMRALNALEAKRIIRKRTLTPVSYTLEPYDNWVV